MNLFVLLRTRVPQLCSNTSYVAAARGARERERPEASKDTYVFSPTPVRQRSRQVDVSLPTEDIAAGNLHTVTRYVSCKH